MSVQQVRVGRAEDPERFLATDQAVWFAEVSAAPVEEQLVGLDPKRRFAADVDGSDPGSYPGVYAVFPMSLSVPGPTSGPRRVPCAGLTFVGVHPDHRRQGVLNAMMRHHLEQVHAEEETAVSALHASEPAIYGRYGYGLASLELEVSMARGARLSAPHLEDAAATVGTQLTTASDADGAERLRDCHDAWAAMGSVIGEPGYYRRICTELPEHLRDKEPWRVLFARRDGHDVGFAKFRRTPRWDNARPSGHLEVWSVVGEPAAQLALLRRLLDYDLVGTVKVNALGVEQPLLHWLGGPRSASDVATYDSLWVRLVDLPRALQARSWSAPCDVVVGVTDPHAPWNEGGWRIVAGDDGTAEVSRTGAPADVLLGVDALGAAYLGAGNLVARQHAGLLVEHRAGAVAELWRAMRTDVAPTAAFMF